MKADQLIRRIEIRDRTERIGGLVISYQAREKLEVLSELRSGRKRGGIDHATTLAAGGRYKFSERRMALFMVGRSVRTLGGGEPRLIGYVGLRFSIGSKQ